MTISILNIRTATPTEWDEAWDRCHYSTYFHSREWAEIWKTYTEGRVYPAPKYIQFSDNKSVIFPLSIEKSFKGLIKLYLSSPAGTYGGWISIDKIDKNHINSLIKYSQNNFRNMSWRINPYDYSSLSLLKSNCQLDETHCINLNQGFDKVYSNSKKSNIRALKKAKREGIFIKKASTLDEWLAYYNIYEDSLRRWGDRASSSYKKRLFEILFLKKSKNIKLWIAYHEEKAIAGAILFYSREHAVYWHGAALSEFFNLRPINLLMWEVIKDACNLNLSWFDFNPSGNHEGVKTFKKSFGSDTLECPIWSSNGQLYIVVKQGKNILNRLMMS